jgi:hypothetical protein
MAPMPTPEEDKAQRSKVAAVLKQYRRDAKREANTAADREERSAEIKKRGYIHWLKAKWRGRS